MRAISVEELKARRDAGAPHLLLDVRDDDEVAHASIPGAVHIPMPEIPQRLDDLPRDVELVVMCHLGGRSARVVQFLNGLGYENAVNLDGGIDAWSARIDPGVLTY